MYRRVLSLFVACFIGFEGVGLAQNAVPQNATAQQQTGVQQQGGIQPGGNQAAGQQRQVPIVPAQQAIQQGFARAAQQPFAPLSTEEQAWVDQVLSTWEQHSANIKRYSCDLYRWQFDPTRYDVHHTEAEGTLRFEGPGKGELRLAEVRTLAELGPPAVYRVNPREPHGEHWICDGDWVHILDHNQKKANRIQLPPEMRGKLVYRSPLPFVFGVKAAELKQRYWIRPLNRPERPKELWLEVFPKHASDAGNYSRLQVGLDRSDILPAALIVLMPNWTPKQPHREVYQFTDRQVNVFRDALLETVFRQAFIKPNLGSDWTVSEEPWIPPEQAGGTAPGRVAAPAMNQPVRR